MLLAPESREAAIGQAELIKLCRKGGAGRAAGGAPTHFTN